MKTILLSLLDFSTTPICSCGTVALNGPYFFFCGPRISPKQHKDHKSYGSTAIQFQYAEMKYGWLISVHCNSIIIFFFKFEQFSNNKNKCVQFLWKQEYQVLSNVYSVPLLYRLSLIFHPHLLSSNFKVQIS